MAVRRLIRSFGHALDGLWHVVISEPNARIHLIAAAMVVGAGLGLGVQRQDWLWLSAAIGMVWVAESLNTAFEYLCDALRPERDEMIKRAKDVAAGATLIAALTAMAIGALVFAPYLF